MGETFEAGEAQKRPPRKSLADANPAAHHQEDRQQGKHAENGNAADPRQLAAMEVAPVAPRRLNQIGGISVGDRYPPADLVALLQRLQKLVFLNGFSSRLEGKLGGRGTSQNEQQRECGEQRPETGEFEN